VFIQEGAVQTLDKAVALRAANLGGAVFDPFELEKQLIGMTIRAVAELPAFIRENHCDPRFVLLEKRLHILVQNMHGRNRQFAGVEASPGVAGVVVDHRLQIDSANTFQGANKERVHSNRVACVSLSMCRSILAEVWTNKDGESEFQMWSELAEALEQLDLV